MLKILKRQLFRCILTFSICYIHKKNVILQRESYLKQMATKEQVEDFLKMLKEKIKVFNIIFRDDRGKNLQTLATLEITPTYRKQVILNIEPEDYVEGPIVDTLNKMGEMWVFGKNVKKQEVYIKIMLGQPNRSTICISFHIAEYPLNYPFKN